MGTQILTADLFRQILSETRREYSYPPGIHFNKHDVDPPNVLYLGPDDFLQTSVFTTATTTNLTLALRYLDANGAMHYETESLDGATLSTVVTKVFTLSEGWLLGASVTNLGGGLADSTCWVSLALQQPGGANRPAHTLLGQGYVTNLFGVTWPAEAIRQPPGSGATLIPVSQTVANPAAGAEWTFTVPAGTKYYLKSLNYTLVTSATVATRISQILIDDGTRTLYKSEVNQTQAASLTTVYSGASGILDTTATVQSAHVSLPTDMALAAAWRVRTSTTAIQVADQYSAITLGLLQFS